MSKLIFFNKKQMEFSDSVVMQYSEKKFKSASFVEDPDEKNFKL